jgi:hypothetical protein
LKSPNLLVFSAVILLAGNLPPLSFALASEESFARLNARTLERSAISDQRPCSEGSLCFADNEDGSSVIPTRSNCSSRITCHDGTLYLGPYGMIDGNAGRPLGGGNSGDEEVYYGVTIGLIGKTWDNKIATLHFKTPTAPDLQITSVQGPSASKVGGYILVRCSIKNSGYEPAKGAKVEVYLSTDKTITPGKDRRLGICTLPMIEAQSALTKKIIVRIPPDVLPREYYLGAFVDAYNTIAKVNETNNKQASNRTIQILPNESLPAVRSNTWRNPVSSPFLSFVLPRL